MLRDVATVILVACLAMSCEEAEVPPVPAPTSSSNTSAVASTIAPLPAPCRAMTMHASDPVKRWSGAFPIDTGGLVLVTHRRTQRAAESWVESTQLSTTPAKCGIATVWWIASVKNGQKFAATIPGSIEVIETEHFAALDETAKELMCSQGRLAKQRCATTSGH